MQPRKILFLFLGPLLFFLTLAFFKPEGLPDAGRAVLACTLWIAAWWITEVIPIAVTSLLPLVLFPVSGALDMTATAAPYGHKILFLFVGGFMLALAMERWNLHRRIALNLIAAMGTNMHQIVLGFILATGLLSMWISNTATTVMMLPIGLAIIGEIKSLTDQHADNLKGMKDFGKVLMLAIAYAASIGGLATLVGTPTNLIFSGFVENEYGIEISFASWAMIGVPISLMLLIIMWQHLVRRVYKLDNRPVPGAKMLIQGELNKLGKIKYEEQWVLAIFVLVAFSWMTRKYLINPFFPAINDTIIALSGAMTLFIIPAKSPTHSTQTLLDWKTAVKLPWGVLLLFGAGFAIAAGFEASGLALWLGQQLSLLSTVPFIVMLIAIIAGVNFLTEITSNMATCTLMMPVLAKLAPAIDVHPYGLMVSATVAASCAFMLPVATAPNAVVFGSGLIEMKDMIRAGFQLNIISIVIITIVMYFLLPLVWGIDLGSFPVAIK
ncbi:MAG: DASS family sodium-coupled anion symporter [Bacteroidia bacterium]